jgi:hypothetical protein
MNNRSAFRAFVIAALVIGAAAAIGIGAYNAGVTHGIVVSGRAAIEAPAGAGGPVVYVWPRPWGFGFGFFPFFLFLFLFFALRGLLWRGGPWRGGWGYRYEGVPPAFEEWHRRAHAQDSPAPPSTAAR